jgi:hypothetical protein
MGRADTASCAGGAGGVTDAQRTTRQGPGAGAFRAPAEPQRRAAQSSLSRPWPMVYGPVQPGSAEPITRGIGGEFTPAGAAVAARRRHPWPAGARLRSGPSPNPWAARWGRASRPRSRTCYGSASTPQRTLAVPSPNATMVTYRSGVAVGC